MPNPTTPPTDPLLHIQQYWTTTQTSSPIYSFLLSDISLLSASPGLFTARLPVKPHHLNSKGTLHGTVSACLTDWAGGMAIATYGFEKTGVSTDIHVTFVSTAREGDVLEIEGRADKVGGTLAFTSVEVRRMGEDGGGGGGRSVVARGVHTKYVKA